MRTLLQHLFQMSSLYFCGTVYSVSFLLCLETAFMSGEISPERNYFSKSSHFFANALRLVKTGPSRGRQLQPRQVKNHDLQSQATAKRANEVETVRKSPRLSDWISGKKARASRGGRDVHVATPSGASSLVQKNMYVYVPYGDDHLEGCLHGDWQPSTREVAAKCASQGPEYEETQTYYVHCFRGNRCVGGIDCLRVRGRERLFTCPQNCEGKWERTESHLPSVEQCVNDGRRISKKKMLTLTFSLVNFFAYFRVIFFLVFHAK
ncbi:unnamed protein product [Amoebophrya sp. A120]|nr:unnamed protein product [Amoebophrya sp. A120]|eukprot:GSA120T00006927001.1